MTTYTEFTEKLGDAILETCTLAQEGATQLVATLSDAVPAKSVVADVLPAAQEMTNATFDLVRRVVEVQRDAALKLLSSASASASA